MYTGILPYKYKEANCKSNRLLSTKIGGEEGIRTLAPVARSNGLANRPLRPTWVLLHIN